MKSCLIRPLILGVFAFPLIASGQQAGEGEIGPDQGSSPHSAIEAPAYSDPGNNFSSNVPINELSPTAYRRFHRRFQHAGSGEYWFKSAQGYKVSFHLDQRREYAYYDPSGGFQYSVKYEEGMDIPRDATDLVKRRFPDYRIKLVTEINDGQKTFYMVQILNSLSIKLLSLADGRIEIVRELTNAGVEAGQAEAAR